MSLKAK